MSNPPTPMPEFGSIAAGFAHCAHTACTPFVVRACADFAQSAGSEDAVRQQLVREAAVHGYGAPGSSTQRASGREAHAAWAAGTLAFNVVDAPSQRGATLLPAVLRTLGTAAGVDSAVQLAYVLTLASVASPLHTDPPYGSGWQWLARGEKQWTVCDPAVFLLSAAGAPFCNGQAYDLAELVRVAARAPPHPPLVFAATIGAGDFLSCPMGWPHAVWTPHKCIGLSGYTVAALPAPGAQR